MTTHDGANREVAWITGASSGIGRALALRMARAGWIVAASARSTDDLQALARDAEGLSGSIHALPLDILDKQAVAACVAEVTANLGPIDQAVLNAGTHIPIRAHEFASEPIRKLVEVNVMGTVHCLEPLIADMMARQAGRIAVVASVAGYVGLPTSAGYGLTKAGLINMCEALKPELDRNSVRLQLVCPGFVKTPLTDKNEFPMPFLMELDEATERFYRGLQGNSFDVVFPWRLAALLRLLQWLPRPLQFALTRRMIPND